MRLRTETYIWGDVIIFRCVGHLVAGQATTAFCERVHKLLSEKRRVVVNLTNADRVDSTGLAVLVRLFTRAGGLEGDARLVSSRMYLTELLRRTRLDKAITVYASEEEAVASLPKKASA